MNVPRRAATVLSALVLAVSLPACSDDAQDAVPGEVVPGTREEGFPEEPIGDEDTEGEVSVPLPEETAAD